MSINRYLTLMSLFFLAGILLGGCAAKRPCTFKTCDLNKTFESGDYVQKVDNFLVILDATGSMDQCYEGQKKLNRAKNLVGCMNQTIPDMPLTAGLRSLGQSWCPFGEATSLDYGLSDYTRKELQETINGIGWAGGESPLEIAINAARGDLKGADGKTALIIFSDGKNMDKAPVQAARNMKNIFEENLCIYTVLIGRDKAGAEIMKKIAKAGDCGFCVYGDCISSAKGMGDFVKNIFLKKSMTADSDGDGVINKLDECPDTPKGVAVDEAGCPPDTDGDGVYDYKDECPNTPQGATVDSKGCALDSDGDGVYDHRDECPNTPEGANVNDLGCWVLESINFETAKWEIQPDAYAELNEVVTVMKENPNLRVKVEGHTDSVGGSAYNQELSEKRAKAVMEYLIDQDIAPERLSYEGYGPSRPIAPNNTSLGRAKNRRVELTPMD